MRVARLAGWLLSLSLVIGANSASAGENKEVGDRLSEDIIRDLYLAFSDFPSQHEPPRSDDMECDCKCARIPLGDERDQKTVWRDCKCECVPKNIVRYDEMSYLEDHKTRCSDRVELLRADLDDAKDQKSMFVVGTGLCTAVFGLILGFGKRERPRFFQIAMFVFAALAVFATLYNVDSDEYNQAASDRSVGTDSFNRLGLRRRISTADERALYNHALSCFTNCADENRGKWGTPLPPVPMDR